MSKIANVRRIERKKIDPEYREHINRLQRTNVNIRLNQYKKFAEEKRIKWELTDDEAINLINGNCKFCDDYITDNNINCISRIIIEEGFTIDNVCSSCSMCNRMKGKASADVLIKRCKHIAREFFIEERPDLEDFNFPEVFDDITGSTYNAYKSAAIEVRNKEFLLTEEQYYEIKSAPCFYCGKDNSDTHTNGIDRYDNSNKTYAMDGGCVSCCGTCNCMKLKYIAEEFLQKCLEVATFRY
jgi:hypothetical protein